MTMTINVRIDHLNSGNMNGQARHDARAPGHVPDYVDKSRIDKNSILIRPPDSAKLAKEMAKHRKAAKPKQQALRKDARIAMSGIITFGDEANVLIGNMSPEEQNKIFLDCAKKISEHVDRELIGLVVHRDETNPHAHFILRGYKYNPETGEEMPTRLSKSDTSELQDIGAIPVAHLGIVRGTPKAQRIAAGEDREDHEHISVKGMHARAAADKARIAELEARIANLESRAELAYDSQDAAEERLKEMNEEIQEKQAKRNALDEELNAKISQIKHYNDLTEKAKDKLKQRENLTEQKISKLEKRVNVYENRLNNLVKDVATMENLDIKDIRESLEKTGHLSPAVVMPFDEESHEEIEVNHAGATHPPLFDSFNDKP